MSPVEKIVESVPVEINLPEDEESSSSDEIMRISNKKTGQIITNTCRGTMSARVKASTKPTLKPILPKLPVENT